jgi:hypothetical protein
VPTLALLLPLVVLVAGMPAASAETTTTINYAGVSVNGASIPAASIQLTVVHPTAFVSVLFSVGGHPVGQSSDIRRQNGVYSAAANVDLAGLSGRTTIRARIMRTSGISSSVDKSFFAVPPLPLAAQPGTAAQPATATVAAPTSAAGTPLQPEALEAAPTVRPGSNNTGVPPGATLTPRLGNVVITVDGSTLENLDVTGCINVRANNVTIRNVRVSCARSADNVAVRLAKGYRGLLVEDSEVDGMGTTQVGIGYSQFTLRRVEVRNTGDGIRIGSGSSVEGSWVHDMVRLGALHPDAIQTTGGTGIIIRGNTLSPANSATGDPNNAAIMMGSEEAPQLASVLVEDNVLSGGNMTVNVRGDTVVQDVVVRRNVFSGGFRYGPMQAPDAVVAEANILSANGNAITVKRAS